MTILGKGPQQRQYFTNTRPSASIVAGVILLVFSFQALAAPPEVSVGMLPQSTEVEQTFDLTLDLKWLGADRDIQIVGLDLGVASPFEVGTEKQSQRRRDDVVSHRLITPITPKVPGDVLLGPIALLYQEGADETILRLQLPGTYPLTVAPKGGAKTKGALLFVLMIFMGAGIYFVRRNLGGNRSTKANVDIPSEALKDFLDAGQSAAKRGDWEDCLGALIELRTGMDETSAVVPPLKMLEEMHQRLRYGGGTPDGHKINRWLRAFDRELSGAKQIT